MILYIFWVFYIKTKKISGKKVKFPKNIDLNKISSEISVKYTYSYSSIHYGWCIIPKIFNKDVP